MTVGGVIFTIYNAQYKMKRCGEANERLGGRYTPLEAYATTLAEVLALAETPGPFLFAPPGKCRVQKRPVGEPGGLFSCQRDIAAQPVCLAPSTPAVADDAASAFL